MKKILSLFLIVLLLIGNASIISASQINSDTLVISDEASVKEFARLYIEGKSFDKLFAMYDEVLVMHIPQTYFSDQLKAVEHLTGKFVSFGNYEMIDNGSTRTHVLYLNMEHKREVMMLTMGPEYRSKDKTNDFSKIQGLLFAMINSDGSEKIIVPTPNDTSFTEQEIEIGIEPWKVKASIIIPNGKAVHKAAVLVQGEGVLDRDSSVQAIKPMKDIAQGLAKFGIASIRFDKRILNHYETCNDEYFKSFTVKEDLIEDTVFATKALIENNSIDKSNIFLIGHGIGGTLLPRIIEENNDLYAGFVMLSSPAISMLETIKNKQLSTLSSLSGQALSDALNTILPELEKIEGISNLSKEEAINQKIFNKNMFYFYEQQGKDNADIINNINKPILIIQGGRDFELNSDIGINMWKKMLNKKTNVLYKKYSTLNHMLMEYKGDLKLENTLEEYTVPANVSNQVISDLAAWIDNKGE